MSDATGDGGAHEASAMGVSDGDFDVTDRPRGKPGRRHHRCERKLGIRYQ